MILTFTPNPSLDRTLELGEPLQPGAVQRLTQTSDFAGGKGINVAHACALAECPTLALFPARPTDLFVQVMADTPVDFCATPSSGAVRTNITITDPSGETTKLNGPGPYLTPADVVAAQAQLVQHAASADYVVLAGSLPRGVDPDFYCELARMLIDAHPTARIAVDTSDAPLCHLGENLDSLRLDVLKPNGFELGQITGWDGAKIEQAAAAGDYTPCAQAAFTLVERGLRACLTTLGSSGAVLTTADGSWVARPTPITPVSTVGAGDCTLAGYVMARSHGADEPSALNQAVAYGTAATKKPGTMIPSPHEAADIQVSVTTLA